MPEGRSTISLLVALLRGVEGASREEIRGPRTPGGERVRGGESGWEVGRSLGRSLAAIVLCGGFYGASIGAWRAAEQAFYCALKLPLLLLSTALVCTVLNALWARRLGLDLSPGECLRAVLLAFAYASVVLAALAPVLLFFDRTLPGPWSPAAWSSHNLLGFAHVGAVAAAGTLALSRQRRWLAELCPRTPTAGGLAALWLAVHLIVGAQISWNLRPWFGSPGLEVEFLREDPFDGTFYESLIRMARPRSRTP